MKTLHNTIQGNATMPLKITRIKKTCSSSYRKPCSTVIKAGEVWGKGFALPQHNSTHY